MTFFWCRCRGVIAWGEYSRMCLFALSLSSSLSLVMDMEHEIPKKIGVLATHGDGEPPKTLDAHYVKDIMHYFDNPEKTPFNLIMGVTLDQCE